MSLFDFFQKLLPVTPGQFFIGIDRKDEARGVNDAASERELQESVRAAQIQADQVRQQVAEMPNSVGRAKLEQQASDMEALAERAAAYAQMKKLETSGLARLSEAMEGVARWAQHVLRMLRMFPPRSACVPGCLIWFMIREKSVASSRWQPRSVASPSGRKTSCGIPTGGR